MTTFFLISLAVFDLLILVILIYQLQFRKNNVGLLEDLNEEKEIIKSIKNEIIREQRKYKVEIEESLRKVKQIAAEVERELQLGKETLSSHLTEIVQEISDRLDSPVVEISKKQHQLEKFYRKLEQEKELLKYSLKKGEMLQKFFQNDLPYDEILKEIESKKYDDARKLLAKGYTKKRVIDELGLRPSEIDLILSVPSS